jgi:hypothetical protein
MHISSASPEYPKSSATRMEHSSPRRRAFCVNFSKAMMERGICEAYRDGVAADIIKADVQLGDLQMLDAVHAVTFVQDSVLHFT